MGLDFTDLMKNSCWVQGMIVYFSCKKDPYDWSFFGEHKIVVGFLEVEIGSTDRVIGRIWGWVSF